MVALPHHALSSLQDDQVYGCSNHMKHHTDLRGLMRPKKVSQAALDVAHDGNCSSPAGRHPEPSPAHSWPAGIICPHPEQALPTPSSNEQRRPPRRCPLALTCPTASHWLAQIAHDGSTILDHVHFPAGHQSTARSASRQHQAVHQVSRRKRSCNVGTRVSNTKPLKR